MTDLIDRIRPALPWRVYAGRVSTDYVSKEVAYGRVTLRKTAGLQSAVYQWRSGAWQLVERVEAAS